MSPALASDTLKVEWVKRGAHPHVNMTALTSAHVRALDQTLHAGVESGTLSRVLDAVVDAPVEAVPTPAPVVRTATAAPAVRKAAAVPRGSRFAAAKRAMTARDAERLARHRAPLRRDHALRGGGSATGAREGLEGESLAAARIARAVDVLREPSTASRGAAAQRAVLERMGLLRSEIVQSFRLAREGRARRGSVGAAAAAAEAQAATAPPDFLERGRFAHAASHGPKSTRGAAATSTPEDTKSSVTQRGARGAEVRYGAYDGGGTSGSYGDDPNGDGDTRNAHGFFDAAPAAPAPALPFCHTGLRSGDKIQFRE